MSKPLIGPDSLYRGKWRKISKSHRDLDLDPTMPIIELIRDIFIYYKVFEFHVARSITFWVIVQNTHTHTHTHRLSRVTVGLDEIGPRCLNIAAKEIVDPLYHIINSIQSCMFPDCWKKARVFPSFKSGSTQNCDNYRPISILCSL